ncbi:MAG: hypothetical protein WCP59_18010, partial [Actinomycetota bacterium]
MADDPTPEPLRRASGGSARKVRQARELLQGFSSELIGVEQFADLLGLSASTAAQIRRDRRAAADVPADPRAGVRAVEFPAGIPDGARSVVHRLGGLLDWIEHVARYEAMVELDPTTIARWRLDRRVRSATAKSGTARTRCGLAAIALQHVSTGTADEQLAADLWQTALQPNSTARVNTEAIPKLAPEVERLWASLADGDPNQPATASHRRRFADALDDIALAPDLADSSSESRRTAPGLSPLVEAALDVQPGQRLLEHGCGECRVMAAVAEETRDASGRQTVELFGSESDERAYLIGRARLALRGLDHHITHGRYRPSIGVVAAADQYERILVDLGSKDPDLIQWLDDASTLCTPDGRVVVVLSTSTSRLLLAWGRVPNVAVIISTR